MPCACTPMGTLCGKNFPRLSRRLRLQFPKLSSRNMGRPTTIPRLSRRKGTVPSSSIPIHASSFGVIPKRHQPGKWRLILDLSRPRGSSVNDGISREHSFGTTSSHHARASRNALSSIVSSYRRPYGHQM